MRREQNPNLTILELAVRYLGPLADDMVFIGGCATGLLLTDPAAPPIRGTLDVDVITEATSLAEYHRLSEQLRERGFFEDRTADAPVCRWKTREIILDVMPADPAILGFGNEWYRPALRDGVLFTLPSGARIKMVNILRDDRYFGDSIRNWLDATGCDAELSILSPELHEYVHKYTIRQRLYMEVRHEKPYHQRQGNHRRDCHAS